MDDSIEAIIERNRKSYINRENGTLYEKSGRFKRMGSQINLKFLDRSGVFINYGQNDEPVSAAKEKWYFL